MQENYLAKWLNNELTEEELATFKKSAEYATYEKIARATNRLKAPEFDQTKAWEQLKEKTTTNKETKVVVLNPFKNFLRVAAVIAILLTGSYFFLNSLDQTYESQFAQQTEVVLPDNSEIVLNAASKVSFSENKWDKKRDVALEGEAFFKVAKGKKFTVTTSSGKIAVLGTQFNVKNRDDFFMVSCFEGLVSVTYNNEEIKLPAGTSFTVIDGNVSKGTALRNGKPSWLNKESSFTSTPLKFVLAEFERQFNIKVETQNINTNKLFTGTFSNSDINLALKSISTPTQIRFKLGEEKVLFYDENTP